MDRLRVLRYLEVAAAKGSFSAAARRFDVSVAAVAKLVGSLERDLGVRLVETHPRGLTVTAAGVAYLEACLPALRAIDDADEKTRSALARPRGKVVVGVQHVVARGLLTGALPRFHDRHPDVELDIRDYRGTAAEQIAGLDVILALGWPAPAKDLVHRVIAAGRLFVVAAPTYWAARGVPQRPRDLEAHVCLPIRDPQGELMDAWAFRRGDEEEAVRVGGWLAVSNAHRDLVVDLALAGHGAIRLFDWTNRDLLASGRLVRVLADWESVDVVPVNLLHPPSARRLPRVRAFIDFATEIFEGAGGSRPFEAERSPVRRGQR
jgi:DNA-binding transcriptional LysR family regulator